MAGAGVDRGVEVGGRVAVVPEAVLGLPEVAAPTVVERAARHRAHLGSEHVALLPCGSSVPQWLWIHLIK